MTEEQRTLWTLSTPIMSDYNIALQDFIEITYTTREQHKDSSASRIERDTLDISKIYAKLSTCSPFSDDPSLRNIINGIVAKEDVNVYEYESVGKNVVHNMIGQNVFSFAFKRTDKVRTLNSSSAVTVAQGRSIDPGLLFLRFLVVSKTKQLNLEEVMRYELSAYPTSLFEDIHILRKADKPQLAHAIDEYCNNQTSVDADQCTEKYVIDGGYLIRKLKWRKGDTYRKIARMYADFTSKHYGMAIVLFDGYDTGPSIKDNTHKRRKQNFHNPVVHFTGNTEFQGKQEEFLSAGCNKKQLIKLISEEMVLRGCTVFQAEDDADVDIAKAAVNSARKHSTTLIGNDTDLLILLLYYAEVNGKPLYFRSYNQSRDISKLYNINKMKSTLGSELCAHLLFIHAFTGCDSTSRIYGVGKKLVFEKFLKGDPVLHSCATEFTLPGKNPANLVSLGRQAMLVLFGSNITSSLAALRYQTLTKKVVAAKSFVNPERLPPTESSNQFHCLRVYYHIMTWMSAANDMNPINCGWELDNDELVPIMSDVNVVSDILLKIIHCNCKTVCSGNRCICRTNGLPCSSVCGLCQVTHCDNQESHEPEDSDEELKTIQL